MLMSRDDIMEWRRPGLERAGHEDELLPDLTWGVRNPEVGMVELQEALLEPLPCVHDWPCDCWEAV